MQQILTEWPFCTGCRSRPSGYSGKAGPNPQGASTLGSQKRDLERSTWVQVRETA